MILPLSITPEIAKFAKDSAHWWDINGPFAPLHRLNPIRLSYITGQIGGHFGRDLKQRESLKNLSILDIGCGGGLVCEPMARLGAQVTGIDADAQAISVAKEHAKTQGLEIEYLNQMIDRNPTPSPLRGSPPSPSGRGKKRAAFQGEGLHDAILALEILEHIDDPQDFIDAAAAHLKPGGIMIVSTLNRTAKSFALGVVAAEYIFNWVPKGTHDWRKFIRPAQMARIMRSAGLNPTDATGMVFQPLKNEFTLSKNDLSVNYFLSAIQDKKRVLS